MRTDKDDAAWRKLKILQESITALEMRASE
jgi:hypothetical protein